MISSAALSGRVPAIPLARPGRAGRAAEAPTPTSSSAVPPTKPLSPPSAAGGTAEAPNSERPASVSQAPGGPRREPTPPTSERNTIPMTNIQQPTDKPAENVQSDQAADLGSLATLFFNRGYALGLADAKASV
jgi:hypothetical protein